jgi:hypothetical protein
VRFVLLIAALAVAACTPTTTLTDAAVAVGGCRFPSTCMRTNCECTRAGVKDCTLCDPVMQGSQSCDCRALDGAAVCSTVAALCIGRAPAACPGVGARCLPAGTACSAAGGEPPQVVPGSSDAGVTEARCPFVDDVCCPPAPEPDLSANVTDMGGTD